MVRLVQQDRRREHHPNEEYYTPPQKSGPSPLVLRDPTIIHELFFPHQTYTSSIHLSEGLAQGVQLYAEVTQERRKTEGCSGADETEEGKEGWESSSEFKLMEDLQEDSCSKREAERQKWMNKTFPIPEVSETSFGWLGRGSHFFLFYEAHCLKKARIKAKAPTTLERYEKLRSIRLTSKPSWRDGS